MNSEQILVLFGQKGGVKKILFQDMTDGKQQMDKVTKLQPISSSYKKLSILSLPSSQMEINNIVPTLKLLHCLYNQSQRITQLVFCIQDTDFLSLIEQIMFKLNEFYYQLNHQSITFMIDQNQMKKVYLNEQLHSQKINLVCYDNQNKSQLFQNMQTNTYLSPWQEQLINIETEPLNPITQFCLFALKKKLQNDFLKVLEQIENFDDENLLRSLKTKIKIHTKGDLIQFLLKTQSILKNQLKYEEISQILANKNWNCKCCSKCHQLFSIPNQCYYILNESFQLKISQQTEKGNKTVRCISCKNPMSEKMQYITKHIIELIIVKSLMGLYKYLQSLDEIKEIVHQKKNQQDMEIEYQEKSFSQDQNSENKQRVDENKSVQDSQNLKFQQYDEKEKLMTVLFLSCDSEEKSFIFEKLNYSQPGVIIQDGQFFKSKVFENQIQFINAPYFSFEEDDEDINKKEQFIEYFKSNKINFIFFFLDNQRIPQMKENLMFMLQQLYSIERSKMGVVVTNWTGREGKIQNDVRNMVSDKQIQKCIFLRRNESQTEALRLFLESLSDINEETIDFSQTVFAQQTVEQECQTRLFNQQLKQEQIVIQKSYLTNLQLQLDKKIKSEIELQEKMSKKQEALTQLNSEIQQMNKDSQNNKSIIYEYKEKINQLQKLLFQNETQAIKSSNQ